MYNIIYSQPRFKALRINGTQRSYTNSSTLTEAEAEEKILQFEDIVMHPLGKYKYILS